ncbi:trifunctional glycosyltransferase/class I SAM-dependent methyltransferase/polysaccharide deacetylase [Microcoleus sp. FACHB-68]|uniref:trifunctional glycosyltransferase/class I SAM-dependent methyltransferase/polysaccharide deacetylase n=1 Tax=Microcoleus sp. FACHB-68 TaxID=2692826 RepID=UPI001685FCC1|nr:trifunctional glycosyltransferase/class I SAM-dependent methyltransferase/polysaccharide deacetylase [Microcoleus sp. FACHB-68]MBD1940286.1 glycosyltransferase [Microcoleus sp. FACHB-68]
MKVSVVIPAHNAAATIAETLQSLQSQSFTGWEAIVVDDGSRDTTSEIVSRFAQEDSRIRIVSQPNQGVSAARNTGIEHAGADWLLFLDADDWILPQHLERLTKELISDASIDAVYSGWARIASDGSLFYEGLSGKPVNMFATLAGNNVFAIHACIVRRSIVAGVGGFDPSLKTCEDWDLWQRIARTGAHFSLIPEPLAQYRMRPDSASTNNLQLFNDGLRVIARGHAPDPRVPNPSAAYAAGLPAEDLPKAKLNYLCWNAGLTFGRDGDPLNLLEYVAQEHCPGLDPELVAQFIFRAALLPNCLPAAGWVELWPRLEGRIQQFLSALEAQSLARALARHVSLRLENLILEHSKATRPLTIGTTHAVLVEITEPILDISAPPAAERLQCAVEIEGEQLGTLELPVCDGWVLSYVLSDAIAAEFSWTILQHFFQKTVYRELTIRRDATGTSLWRGSLCLASELPADEPALWATAHDRICWIVFLQELWGRPDWPETHFYNPRIWRVFAQELLAGVRNLPAGKLAIPKAWTAAPKRSATAGPIAVEISQELPDIAVSDQPLQVVPTVGGVALGVMPVNVNGKILRAQEVRVAVMCECGFELVHAAVREGILGRKIAGASLRERLAAAAGERASKKQDVLLQTCASNAGTVFARHPGAIETSVSRRAMLPAGTLQDLVEAATIAGEPVIKASEGRMPAPVIYAPEAIWLPPAPVAGSEGKSQVPVLSSADVYGRKHFETLFATQPDPWKYTSPYEQTKYEQTLEMLPADKIERVLELACAEGHFTVQLAPRAGSLLAADISQVALDRAAERCAGFENVRFTQLDLSKDAIPGKFELILCCEVLYYVGGKEELRTFARKVADALEPGGYFLTAHANLVVDEPDRTGYNWDHPFGAKFIGETFASTPPLKLVKELRTPLYRIQVFQHDAGGKVTTPEIVELPQPTPPPPAVAGDVLWEGGSPNRYGERKVVTERLPILMYHRVAPTGSAANARYRVTPEAFEEQLRYLRDAGFYSVTLEEWRKAMVAKKPLAGRGIIITFDDGYVDFLTYAWPLLKQYGFSAIVFLVADRVGGTNCWDSIYGEELPLLGWEDIRRLQEMGVEFASHSATHQLLTTLNPEEIVREGARSRAILQRELGKAINTIAYPHGDTDRVVRHLMGACGYTFGLSCRSGLSRFGDSLLDLPRVEVTGADNLREFVAKLSL